MDEGSKYAEKREQVNKVRHQKQLVDINTHKVKVFLALKPILFQQCKALMVHKSIAKIGLKKACKAHVICSKVHQIVSHVFQSYIDYKALLLEKNRRLWSAVYISIQMKRQIRKFGPDLEERLRRTVTVRLSWGAAPMGEIVESRCKRTIWEVLLTSSKNRQFLLKLKLTVRRILNLQQKARLYITLKKNQHSFVCKSILNGL